jgi:hypothetical protein
MQGPCRLCGHDPACGLASITSDEASHPGNRPYGDVFLCHDDSHSCFVEWTVHGRRPEPQSSGSAAEDVKMITFRRTSQGVSVCSECLGLCFPRDEDGHREWHRAVIEGMDLMGNVAGHVTGIVDTLRARR